jgi:hypothetical protein
MSTNSQDLRGLDSPRHSMFRFTYSAGGKERTHECFATVVGEALYSCHTWLQHKLDLPHDTYQIHHVERLLRYKAKADDVVFQVIGTVPIDDWPRASFPRPKQARAKKGDDDYADGFDFVQEVPKLTRHDVVRKQEAESLVPTDWLLKANGGKL